MNYPPERRFGVWREALASTYDLHLLDGSPEDFNASVEGWMIRDLLLARLTMPTIRFVRSKQKIRDENSDYYVFMCAIEGGGSSGDFDGSAITSHKGETTVTDTTRPFDVAADAGMSISVSVPRRILEAATLTSRSFHGFVITGALGRLIVKHLTHAIGIAPEIRESEAAALSQATVRLLASSLTAQSKEKPEGSALSLFATRQDIVGYVEDNFHRTDLAPEHIFSDLGLSRATAYRAFKESDGIAKHIQQRRLIAARALLHHPQESRSITDIASAVGFDDHPLFSRSYKRVFGETPRQTRDMAQNRSPKIEAASKANYANFRRWMRDLEEHLTKASH